MVDTAFQHPPYLTIAHRALHDQDISGRQPIAADLRAAIGGLRRHKLQGPLLMRAGGFSFRLARRLDILLRFVRVCASATHASPDFASPQGFIRWGLPIRRRCCGARVDRRLRFYMFDPAVLFTLLTQHSVTVVRDLIDLLQ